MCAPGPMLGDLGSRCRRGRVRAFLVAPRRHSDDGARQSVCVSGPAAGLAGATPWRHAAPLGAGPRRNRRGGGHCAGSPPAAFVQSPAMRARRPAVAGTWRAVAVRQIESRGHCRPERLVVRLCVVRIRGQAFGGGGPLAAVFAPGGAAATGREKAARPTLTVESWPGAGGPAGRLRGLPHRKVLGFHGLGAAGGAHTARRGRHCVVSVGAPRTGPSSRKLRCMARNQRRDRSRPRRRLRRCVADRARVSVEARTRKTGGGISAEFRKRARRHTRRR